MADLTLHGEPVGTVFDLLGKKENDITYSVGWALSNSERLVRALLSAVFEDLDHGEVTAVRLQEFLAGGGYTDIEVEAERAHLIVEAKRGWDLPGPAQLEQYAPRLGRSRHGAIVVVSECSRPFAQPRLPTSARGVPVHYLPWSEATALAEDAARDGPHVERRLLRELVRYLRGLMTSQSVRDNMVYVVSLGLDELGKSGLSFKDIVVDHDIYFHPLGGGRGGWPRTPPNYLGFRFNGRLQQIRHVESYEVTEEPWADLPQLKDHVDWTPSGHYVYKLGPVIRPPGEVKTGRIYRNARVWAAFDLLLTSPTIADARDATNERLHAAGEE